jgi:hypothetical protein
MMARSSRLAGSSSTNSNENVGVGSIIVSNLFQFQIKDDIKAARIEATKAYN